ncbi:hypothetical protein HNP52_004419 [Sphingomonas kyeonggiensis]|uniref:Uncharacterized protein n=1 Tax=Sphingomonas kyeonggiensis TaxID=1268553 RepID=A0A7W7K5W3_9SPHN|nr:hypothetical protein [Sphingomonas kyeonggiensis]MBB4841317.1 hypothetical protein [Sphingomonas kyeonggiensis]
MMRLAPRFDQVCATFAPDRKAGGAGGHWQVVGGGQGKEREKGEGKIKQWHHAALVWAASACLHIVFAILGLAPCRLAMALSRRRTAEIGHSYGAIGVGVLRSGASRALPHADFQ